MNIPYYGNATPQNQRKGNPFTIGVAGTQPFQSNNPYSIQVAEQGGGFLGAKEEPGASGFLSSKEAGASGGGGGMGGMMDMFGGGGGSGMDSGGGASTVGVVDSSGGTMDGGGGDIWASLMSIIGTMF